MSKFFILLIAAVLFSGMATINSNAIPIREGQSSIEDESDIRDQYPSQPSKKPASAEDYYKIGFSYLSRKMFLEAGEQFRKAVQLDPKHMRSLIGVAATSFHLGDMDSAVDFSNKAINLQPNSADVRNAVGEIWMLGANSPKYQSEAETRFKEAISLDPKFALAHANLARLYLSMKKIDDSIKKYKDAISVQSKNPLFRLELISVYLNTGSFEAGIEETKKLIELYPQSPIYHNQLGDIYMLKKQSDLALAEFQQAIKLDPKYAPGYKNIANYYLDKGLLDKAFDEFNKALSCLPDYGDAYAGLGNVYLTKGMTQKAEEEYKKAISDKSRRTISIQNLIYSYNNLAYIYSDKSQELDTALSYAQKAKQVAPKHPDIADTLGWVYYKMGKYDEALANLKAASEGSPNNPLIRYHLGAAYYKKGIKDQAVVEIKKSLDINPNFKGSEEAKQLLVELTK